MSDEDATDTFDNRDGDHGLLVGVSSGANVLADRYFGPSLMKRFQPHHLNRVNSKHTLKKERNSL
jgi:cysteine synthase